MVYLERPRGERRYGRWALDAQAVVAVEERPMMPILMGAIMKVCLMLLVMTVG